MKNLYIFIFAFLLQQSSTSAQSGWIPQTSGTTQLLRSVHFASSATGWVAGDGGTILKTTDGGDNWFFQTSGTSSILFSIHFPTASSGYACGSGGIAIKTTNGGDNWTNLSIGTVEDLYSIYFSTSNVGWVTGNNGVIFRTSNAGSNWTPQISGTAEPLYSIHPRAPTAIWAVGGNFFDGVILKSTNQGNNWFSQYTGSSLSSVHFSTTTTGYAVGSSLQAETVLLTTNGGTNWEYAGGNFPGCLNSVYMLSGTTGWTVGCGKIYKLPSLTKQEINPVNNLYDVQMTSSTTGWTVGTNGTILKTTNGGVASFNMNLTGLLEGFYDPNVGKMKSDTVTITFFRVYPFPHKGQETKAYLDSSGNCALTLYDEDNSTRFYIVVNHRNSIETWSDTTVRFSSFSLNYDFTTSASQAYGNNQTLNGTKYCIYGGDVNQNGTVDATDLSLIDNDAYNFVTGYVNTDVTGDDLVDGSDAAITDNNAFNFVHKVTPFGFDSRDQTPISKYVIK